VNSTATTVSSNPEPASASPPLEQNPQTEPKSLPTFRPPAPSANEEDIQTIEEYKAGQEAWDNFGHDINDLFGIYPCDDEVQAVSSIIGEDYDLWSWVKKLAVSPRWKKIIKAPENLVFRMSPNPDTGSSAFMTACRKALQGSRRAASAFQNNPEKQSMKTAGFVVDDI
jgi:hypothetical protein